jgi:hypothetical protein
VPAGTFARAYAANRRIAIEDAIDADPVATCVRELMLERGSWAGRAVDLLRVSADRSRNAAVGCCGCPRLAKKSPRARRPPAARADIPSDNGHRGCLHSRRPHSSPIGQASVTATDDTDGTDANAGFRLG